MSASHYSSTSVVKGRSQSDKPLILPRHQSEVINNRQNSENIMASTAVKSNGFPDRNNRMNVSMPADPSSESIPNGSECDCCPYGFHIDLGFVKYAEDVASGHYLKHLRQLRKAKKKMRKSMEIALAQQQMMEEEKQRKSFYENNVPSSEGSPRRFSPGRKSVPIPDSSSPIDTHNRSGALSPNAESIFSDSLENVMSDFDETFSQQSLGRPNRSSGSAKLKDYSSDFEVATERQNKNVAELGYQSDYGYAIPSQLTRKREKENGNPSVPLSSSLLLNSTSKMNGGGSGAMRRPDKLSVQSQGSLSPTRRMRQMQNESYAAPYDLNLSDSVSSLSSVSSNPTNVAASGNYRGLAGEIAANIENLSSVLRPLEKRYEADRLRGIMKPAGWKTSRRYGSESSSGTVQSEEEEPAVLRAIREQMAVSLHHMKDLEEQVKNIPILSSRISSLKTEKERLTIDLEAAKRAASAKSMSDRTQRPSESDLSPISPPETPDSRPVMNRSFAPEIRTMDQGMVTSMSSSSYGSNRLGRVGSGRPAPPVPPRSTSVDRMREKALSPAPPPPIPPKPTRIMENVAVPDGRQGSMLSSQSGNLASLEQFHSMRRSGPKMRDEDYASDSELALGENRLMDKFASLRRSRRILSQSPGGKTARSYAHYYDSTMSDTEDFYSSNISPPKNYSISASAVCRPKALSSVSTALAETVVGDNNGDPPSAKNGNAGITPSTGYKELLAKWRQDFLTSTADRSETEAAPPSEPTVSKVVKKTEDEPPRRFSASKGTETDREPETEKKSIGVGANIKPELVKSESLVEVIKTGPCPECVDRKDRGRISIGIGTGPVPNPRPAKNCEECKTLKEKVVALSVKPMQFTVETAVGGQEVETPEKSTNTDEKRTMSIATGANLEPPKPETISFSTNTDDKLVSTVGSGTEPPEICNRHVNTEPSLCRHSGTSANFAEFGTEVGIEVNRNDFQSTIGISTEISGDKGFEKGHSRGNLVHSESNTELDLDAILKQAEAVSQKPALAAQGTNTESVRTLEKGTTAERNQFVSSVGTATNQLSFSSTKCGTESPKLAETEQNTDPVEIRSPSELRSAATNTEKTANRSVYIATNTVSFISRSVDAVPRLREAGTNPQRVTSSGGLLSRTTSSNSVGNFLDSPRQGSFDYGERVTALVKRESVEMKDEGAQVDLPPDEEDVMIWVKEYQEQFPQESTSQVYESSLGGPWPPVARISVGVGESSIEEVPQPSTEIGICKSCDKRADDAEPYSFSRNVGVGTCKVTDRVCVSCDYRRKSSGDDSFETEENQSKEEEVEEKLFIQENEMEPPGLSYEQSPAYHEKSVKKSPPQPPPRPHKKQRSESIETAELELPSSTSSSLTSSSNHSLSVEGGVKEEIDKSPSTFQSAKPMDDDSSDEEEAGNEAVEEEGEGSETPPERRKVDMKKPRGTRAFELSKAAATKKMLTSEQNTSPQTFRRGTAASRSMRVEGRKGDHLAYITDKQKSNPSGVKQSNSQSATSSKPTIPPGKVSTGLKGKVAIKQQRAAITTNPKIPRPKFVKNVGNPEKRKSREWSSDQDEQAEAEDRLTPLPSEMMSMTRSAYERSLRQRAQQAKSSGGGAYENPLALEGEEEENGERKDGSRLVGSVVENLPDTGDKDDSSSSDSSSEDDSIEEGSYDTNGNITARCELEQGKMANFEMSAPLKDACDIYNRHLTKSGSVPFDKLTWAQQYLQHEWLKTAARKNTNPHHVEAFLDAAEAYSKQLIHKLVNICDQNENTALHYGVSHGNFDVVSILLDSKVANLNRPNKAGYTPVMLAALCPIMDETVKMVIQRLLQMGDVNIKASQHGQTALMLAVSHGKLETSKLLLEAGAGVNIQDEDGSTALMCAAEHGHKDIVKILLAHQEIDASLSDFDGSTALSIAVDNGHRDIGVLIYAHLNYAKGLSVGESSSTVLV